MLFSLVYKDLSTASDTVSLMFLFPGELTDSVNGACSVT
jgi:hypothetical protein